MKKTTLIFAAASSAFAGAAHAQSNVTLYGLVDAGLTYVSNEATRNSPMTPGGLTDGKATVGMTSGNVQQSRWGLRGVEDLGGGLKAVFNLESGFNVNNGSLANNNQSNNSLFNRQAFVGVSTADYGTLTFGRQYDSVVDYLGPVSAAGTWGGTYFAHRGDNDNLNSTFSISNSVKYQSANYAGASFNALYGFSNNASGFANNRAYSFGAGYQYAGLQFAAAYLQIQGLNSNNSAGAIQNLPPSAMTNLPGLQNQRTWGLGVSHVMGPLTIGTIFTQTRYQDSIGDSSVRYNNHEIHARYSVTPELSLGAAYTYTQGLRSTPRTSSTSNSSSHWNQFGVQADYALSKRTDVYAESVMQIGADNQVGANLTQINGTAAPSTSKSQYVVSAGIRHRF
ncbi:Outer membrane protein porin (plasmid) [Paraburkholderia caribensis MBA4]|uniref:Outer membrane protein porin n=1 Tax=Paraburkholderia caribensis MBA4 TaxID=1323664 RepID=A0A0N7JVY9_9BURK|nr:porin [Paraburkholderia caribensis]ALL70541.1 Outer membrane protein porin [Paraburkholderia caribensis MBA4]